MFGTASQNSEELKYAAALVLAAVDGFSFQYCLNPENFDMTKAFGVLERLISNLVVSTLQTEGRDVAVPAP